MDHFGCLVAVVILIGWGLHQRSSAKWEKFCTDYWKDRTQHWMDAYVKLTNERKEAILARHRDRDQISLN